MILSCFEASTQYTDWKGSAAADVYGPDRSFEELFEATGLVDNKNEFLIAFEFYAGEGYFFLAGYFHPKSESNDLGWVPSLRDDFNTNSGTIRVRKIEVKLTLEQFFKYFKRFNVVLIRDGLDISGREFEISEESVV